LHSADNYQLGQKPAQEPMVLKALELLWAEAACVAFTHLGQPSCTAAEPAWFNQPHELKRMAERAIAAKGPDDFCALQMRADAHEQANPASATINQQNVEV